jgi:formiminotetrahydrofolate cyclodeaminase
MVTFEGGARNHRRRLNVVQRKGSFMNESFLISLARPQPIPGGGAAAAYAASVGLALLEKIVRLEMRRVETPLQQSLIWNELLLKVVRLSMAFAQMRDEDGEAYLRWAEIKTSKENAPAICDALGQATACPIGIMKCIHETMECLIQAGKYAKKHLLSDLLAVCEILDGACKGAAHIACANLQLMAIPSYRKNFEEELARLRTLVEESGSRARRELNQRQHAASQVCSVHG